MFMEAIPMTIYEDPTTGRCVYHCSVCGIIGSADDSVDIRYRDDKPICVNCIELCEFCGDFIHDKIDHSECAGIGEVA
jgi:hypothetical protein